MSADWDDHATRAVEIAAARTEKGGWTRETLERWGVPWPPPKGWKRDLLNREPKPKGARNPWSR